MHRAWALLLVALGTTYAGRAAAQATVKDECVAAAEEGQQLQTARKFVTARDKFLVCSRSACPPVIVRDCSRWLASIDGSLSSVVFAARRADQDLTDVLVRVDGQPLTSSLDGKAILIDPGTHSITFEWSGRQVEQRIVVAEGEKNRKVSIVFDELSGGEREPQREAPVVHQRRPIPLMTYVLGAAALAAFGSAIGFGVGGRSQLDRLHGCAPHCPSSEVSALRTDMVLTDVSLGIGVIAAGIASWLFFTRPTIDAPSARAQGAMVVW
jgi:hypothetical protein